MNENNYEHKMYENKQDIYLLSLNVRGIRDKLKRSKIFSWINNQKPDIVMLQETFFDTGFGKCD